MFNCQLVGGPSSGKCVLIYPHQTEVREFTVSQLPNAAAFAENATIPEIMPINEMIYTVSGTPDTGFRAHFDVHRSAPCGCGMPVRHIKDWPAHRDAVHCDGSQFEYERHLRMREALNDYTRQKNRA